MTTTIKEISKPEIQVTAQCVTVCGVRITRPTSMAPSQWLAFWEGVKGK